MLAAAERRAADAQRRAGALQERMDALAAGCAAREGEVAELRRLLERAQAAPPVLPPAGKPRCCMLARKGKVQQSGGLILVCIHMCFTAEACAIQVMLLIG